MTTNPDGWTYRFEVGGRQIELPEGELTVGRSRTCAVMLNDLSVSRSHAVLRVAPGRLTVRDLESSNGTYLNGIRLAAEAEVADGDRLTIGETDVVVRITPPAPVNAADPIDTAHSRSTEITARCEGCGGPLQAEWSACARCGKPIAPGTAGVLARAAGRDAGRAVPLAAVRATTPVRDPVAAASAPVAPAVASVPPLPRLPPPPPAADAAPRGSAGDGGVLPPLEDAMLRTPAPRGVPLPPPAPVAATVGSPAGFWIRVAASLVDGFVVLLPVVAVQFALGGDTLAAVLAASALGLALGLGLPIVGWSRFGATPGKALLGLRVLGPDGRVGLTPGRAALRVLGYLANLGIGFVLVAFLPGKRGIHDLIAGTSVVRAGR